MLKNLLLAVTLVTTFVSSLSALDRGEELFMQKCAVCHVMQRPADKSQMIAPPAKGIMFHMSEEIGSDEKILVHIKSFTINPTKEKAICRSVRRFGLITGITVLIAMITNLTLSGALMKLFIKSHADI